MKARKKWHSMCDACYDTSGIKYYKDKAWERRKKLWNKSVEALSRYLNTLKEV